MTKLRRGSELCYLSPRPARSDDELPLIASRFLWFMLGACGGFALAVAVVLSLQQT